MVGDRVFNSRMIGLVPGNIFMVGDNGSSTIRIPKSHNFDSRDGNTVPKSNPMGL